MNKPFNKRDIIFFAAIIAAVIAFFVYFYIGSIRETAEFRTYNFSGIVENVRYEKGYPFVVVGGREYFLGAPGYNFEHKIERGDSIKKVKGSSSVIIIKRKTGEILNFDN